MNKIIPVMDDPLSKHWDQPSSDNFIIGHDSDEVIMSTVDYEKLLEYSSSIPSGVYPGKMWKSIHYDMKGKPARSFLMWYGEELNGSCTVHHRQIIVNDTVAFIFTP